MNIIKLLSMAKLMITVSAQYVNMTQECECHTNSSITETVYNGVVVNATGDVKTFTECVRGFGYNMTQYTYERDGLSRTRNIFMIPRAEAMQIIDELWDVMEECERGLSDQVTYTMRFLDDIDRLEDDTNLWMDQILDREKNEESPDTDSHGCGCGHESEPIESSEPSEPMSGLDKRAKGFSNGLGNGESGIVRAGGNPDLLPRIGHFMPEYIAGKVYNKANSSVGLETAEFDLLGFVSVSPVSLSKDRLHANEYYCTVLPAPAGVCVSFDRPISDASMWQNLRWKTELQGVIWAHHNCMASSNTEGNKGKKKKDNFQPGEIVKVKYGLPKLVDVRIGSFFIQAGKDQGWFANDLTEGIKWPVYTTCSQDGYDSGEGARTGDAPLYAEYSTKTLDDVNTLGYDWPTATAGHGDLR